jgi:hypothetical protein
LIVVALAMASVGVTSVGDAARTAEPVPVTALIAVPFISVARPSRIKCLVGDRAKRRHGGAADSLIL